MLKVAVTGNIASGKSQVEKILLSKGYKVCDTDKINHFILASDINVIREIKCTFWNEDIVDDDMNISREKLGKVVFSDIEKRHKLEAIVHAKIYAYVVDFFNKNENEKIVFVMAPLLFECNWAEAFDKIIFVSADEDVRLERLIKRNNYTKEYAQIRIDAQGKEEEKIKKSDYIIYNNTDFISLKNQTDNILIQLLN